MLQGKKEEYTKGVETIRKAITLFENNNFKAGIAVSYFDLALLYDNASQIDSSIFYFEKNKAYFETKLDTFRIFLVNNKLFESYLKKQNLASASKIYEYNLKLEKSSRVHWQHLIDYYRISMDYYKLVDNSELYDFNEEKYKQLSKELKEQGIVVM
jgi:tetratricopeptide (TPR) repeat protein